MIDLQVAVNLTAAVVEGVMNTGLDASKLHGSEIFSTVPMDTETVNVKIELPTNFLEDESGNAAPGVANTETVFSDVNLRATWKKTGKTFDYNDFTNYVIEKKIRTFVETAGELPSLFDERMATRLLVRGTLASNPIAYDNLPFFNSAHPAVPGFATTFSNNVDCGLITTGAPAAQTVTSVRSAIIKGIQNVRSVPLADGAMLDVFEPFQIWCHTLMEGIVSDAWESAFISGAGSGAQDVSAFRGKYSVKPIASPYLDKQIAEAKAAGLISGNVESVMYLVCKPRGDAAGLIMGTQSPFTLVNDLPAITDGAKISSFSMQLRGRNAHNYGLPHFIHRLF